MITYAVDLGTTNIKVALFDETLRNLGVSRSSMAYRRDGTFVEFDPDAVVEAVVALMWDCAESARPEPNALAHIVVTGQAESLVLVDGAGRPVAPGISWMDERSTDEAHEIADHFDATLAFSLTGEPEAVPTWPATKLRWLSKHQPRVLAASRHVLMIKDYLILKLTGVTVGEETTRGFTYLYDVPGRRYWPEMLDFCGVAMEAMPQLVPAGTNVGPVLDQMAERLPPAASYVVNTGALDHFCAMLGTDSYRAGAMSASAGTVLSLSMLASEWAFDPSMRVSFHRGVGPQDTVLFTCADSGGVCLDWLQRAATIPYDQLERALPGRAYDDAPLFLPYLTGVNPPDFVVGARGGFLGLQLRHDAVDLAYAVMEGVAHLLRRNLDYLAEHRQVARSLVSAGGGTASRFWNQLKADVCGLDFHTSDEPEAACRGAAVLTLVAAGVIDSVEETGLLHQPQSLLFHPRDRTHHAQRYAAFDDALRRLYGSGATAADREPQ